MIELAEGAAPSSKDERGYQAHLLRGAFGERARQVTVIAVPRMDDAGVIGELESAFRPIRAAVDELSRDVIAGLSIVDVLIVLGLLAEALAELHAYTIAAVVDGRATRIS